MRVQNRSVIKCVVHKKVCNCARWATPSTMALVFCRICKLSLLFHPIVPVAHTAAAATTAKNLHHLCTTTARACSRTGPKNKISRNCDCKHRLGAGRGK